MYLREYRQFLSTAAASLTEVEYYVMLAEELGYLPAERRAVLEEITTETAKTLHGLANWVSAQLKCGKQTKDEGRA